MALQHLSIQGQWPHKHENHGNNKKPYYLNWKCWTFLVQRLQEARTILLLIQQERDIAQKLKEAGHLPQIMKYSGATYKNGDAVVSLVLPLAPFGRLLLRILFHTNKGIITTKRSIYIH